MAQDQIYYRANIQTSLFPLLSQLSGQTVVVPEQDHTFVPNVNPSDQSVPVDRGTPQLMYCHNVMPSTYGFQSVAYIQQYPAITSGPVSLDNAYLVLSTEKVRTYVAVDYTESKRLYFLSQAGQWQVPVGSPTNLNPINRVSVATVNGVTYVCVARVGTYKYTIGDNTLTQVTLEGLTDANVLGIVSSNGYLITWSTSGVAWSSVNDPLDFEPSDVSGAGAGEVQDAAGDIIYCQNTAYGFIIYTTNNAVSVTYSGNTTYPFTFKSISAAGGIASSDLVGREAVGLQYAYTTNGIQQVYHTGGKTVLPAITDFLAGQTFEDFDESTNSLLVSFFSTTMRKKLAFIADRYLVISYGISTTAPMTHAIIVDVVQSRMGKAKIQHNAVFELRNLAPESIETPRRSIAFLQPNGTVQVMDFNTGNDESSGVIILGKYQLARRFETSLQGVILENVEDADKVEVLDLMSYDGKNFQRVEPLFLDTSRSDGMVKSYLCDLESRNHSILVKGFFNLISPVLVFKLGGDN